MFIAPKQKSSEADPATCFNASNANYKALLSRLVESVVGQSAFQDWAVAEDFNDKLILLDRRADQLQALFLAGTLTPASTAPVSTILLESFFAENNVMTPAALAHLDAARNQLRAQYSKEYAGFGGNVSEAEAWLDAVLVLELAADLHEKEEMLIYDFVADRELLASSGLFAFAGFCDVRYREHDYDYGRTVAQQQLSQYQKQSGSIFAKLHWTPKPIDPIDPKLNNVQMAEVNRTRRYEVYRQIRGAANQMLKELNVNVFIRKPLMWFFVEKEIKRMLGL